MTATDKLRKLLDERGIKHDEEGAYLTFWGDCDAIAAEQKGSKYLWLAHYATPEQAIAATLGRGTMTAEQVKRIHAVIEKHWHDLPADYDMPEATALPDYSYDWQAIADELNAALGCGGCVECAEDMGRYADSLCDPLKQRIVELEGQRDELLRCLENDWNISASWDGLRKFWNIELTEEGVRLRDAEMNSRAERTCKLLVDGDLLHCSNCGGAAEKQSWAYWSHCPNCGKKVVDE